MTNKEAIEYGKQWDMAIESRGDTLFSDARQFLSLAIKALEESKQGEWIHYEEYTNNRTFYITECPFCKLRVQEETNFCPNCGAELKGGVDNDE